MKKQWIIINTLDGRSHSIRESKITEICLSKDGVSIQIQGIDHKIAFGRKNGEYVNELSEKVYNRLVYYLKTYIEEDCYVVNELK